MKKVLGIIILFCFFLILPFSVHAQDIPTGSFKGDYYNGRNFETFVLTRQDAAINFNWWLGSPGPGVNRDNFSVRWQGRFDFSGGDWEFRALPDDGLRAYVDGEKIIDSWKVQHGTFFKVVKNLSAGTHLIVVEYFEAEEWAGIGFNWVKLTPQVTAAPTGARVTPGVPVPTAPPLYKDLYISSCEELKAKPLDGDAPLEVDFSGAGYDPFGVIQAYIFDFGDKAENSILTQEDSYASHIYEKPGSYTAVLTIKDSKGNLRTSDICKIAITVGGYYKEGIGGYAQPTVYPATASTLPNTGIFDSALSLVLITIPMAIFGLLLNRKFSKL